MSALTDLLNSFELQTDNDNGHITHGWLYYGDTDPKEAISELAQLHAALAGARAERDALRADVTGECYKHNLQWRGEQKVCPVCLAESALAAARARVEELEVALANARTQLQ